MGENKMYEDMNWWLIFSLFTWAMFFLAYGFNLIKFNKQSERG